MTLGKAQRTGAKTTVKANAKEILYGTANGYLGQLLMDTDSIHRGWVVEPGMNRTGGIHCISAKVDFTKTGINDIVVGRDDGSIEVYAALTPEIAPQLVYQKCIGESISTIDAGFVTSTVMEDIIVQTFSGKLPLNHNQRGQPCA
ncbi:hypothetical protein CBR_g32190 [Chara braunii]|uniref:BBS7 beta-propeller domain-containing protein n=1 Tax=Chara braunii TaxID=69332 RepID=A0A388JMY9_CHABU|nr:hypothetical protein CBR_g32190 [Chara braunii]|eukprot:GBG59174.1 hypothetical protein CBR_g32190 [Chara braunii]